MKLSAGVLVLVSIVLLGMNTSLRLKKRRDFLSEILAFIMLIKLEIEYVNLPIFDIFEKINASKSCNELDFIPFCLKEKEKGEDFPVAFSKAVSMSALPLKKEEKDKLYSLGNLLGTSDIIGQRSILELYSNSFSIFYKKAQESYEKYGRMSITASFILGAGAFILCL